MTTQDDSERHPRVLRPHTGKELGVTVYDVVRDLRRDIDRTRFPLAIEGAQSAETSRERLLSQLDEHLLPRLRELSSPAIVVVAGSTGAGKSTLYNSILGEEVSEAGVLRPTTREPVLAYNPLDEDVFDAGPVTDLARTVRHDSVPRGTALLDAPDLDSLLAENRQTALTLLEAADLWLFVTTAARYGDALPWQTLAQARERGASVAMVLNRVPQASVTAIRGDLLRRLREHGMENTPLFVVPDAGPHEGLLDSRDVAPIARWLTLLAGQDRARAVIVRTLKGALGALPAWVTGLCSAVDVQLVAAHNLRVALGDVRPIAHAEARMPVDSGRVSRGAVAARWAQLSAERVDRVSVRRGRARGTARRGRRREAALIPLRDEVEAAAAQVLAAAGEIGRAAAVTVLSEGHLPGASTVLTSDGDTASRRAQAAERRAKRWAAGAEEYVAQLADPCGLAAVKAFGAAGLAAVLMAAAAGQVEADMVASAVLPAEAEEVIAALRGDLADRACAMVDAEIDPIVTALAVPELAEGADTALRLRLAELRRLT